MHEAVTLAIIFNLFLYDDLRLLTKIRFVFLNINAIFPKLNQNPADTFSMFTSNLFCDCREFYENLFCNRPTH